METEERTYQTEFIQAKKISNNKHYILIIGVIILLILIAREVGYYIGVQQRRPPVQAQNMTQNTQLRQQQIGWVSPIIPANPTPTTQLSKPLVIKSQSLSPDGIKKIIFKAPQTLVYGDPQEIIVADASGANERIVLRRDFLGGSFGNLRPTNWSPDSKYAFVATSSPETGDLYIFKTTGGEFPNGKPYLLASEIGYPPMPLTSTWITDTQIQIIAHPQGPIRPTGTHQMYTYIFDVDKRVVTEKK